MKISHRLWLIAFFSLYFALSYKGIQFIVKSHLNPVILTLPFEEQIPFIPAFLFLYVSVYLLPAIIFFIPPKKGQAYKMVLVFTLTSIIHYVIFLIMPVFYELRPDMTLMEPTFLNKSLLFLYRMDEPLNCFPSIHVSFAFLCYFFARRYRPPAAPAVLVLALVISLSTLFVKQHYLLDLPAAFLLAYAMNKALIEKDLSFIKEQFPFDRNRFF